MEPGKKKVVMVRGKPFQNFGLSKSRQSMENVARATEEDVFPDRRKFNRAKAGSPQIVSIVILAAERVLKRNLRD